MTREAMCEIAFNGLKREYRALGNCRPVTTVVDRDGLGRRGLRLPFLGELQQQLLGERLGRRRANLSALAAHAR